MKGWVKVSFIWV